MSIRVGGAPGLGLTQRGVPRQRGERTRTSNVFLVAISLLLFAGVLLLEAARTLAADSARVAVSATVLSKSNCKFRAPGAALAFGTLDPVNPADVTRTAALSIRCAGSAANASYLITDDDGLHESGPGAERMLLDGSLTEFLPYSFSYTPASATILKNTDQTITITGTVLGVNYQNALAGSYADTVTLTVVP